VIEVVPAPPLAVRQVDPVRLDDPAAPLVEIRQAVDYITELAAHEPFLERLFEFRWRHLAPLLKELDDLDFDHYNTRPPPRLDEPEGYHHGHQHYEDVFDFHDVLPSTSKV
jgi:hypothetical protein